MKDEIKEILDFIKTQIEQESISYEPDVELSKEEAKLLFDYITNLQEEKIQLEGKIKQLEHNCKQASDSCRQHRLASKNHIRRLERREQQINIYKSRNEKAIEYINTHYLNANEPELLDILQGEDKK